MEKRRIRLEVNGVVCGLITEESDEYMRALAQEVGEMMQAIQTASPYITREAAALTAALSYCDDARRNGRQAGQLQDRVDELEVEAEVFQEEKAAGDASDAELIHTLREKADALEQENGVLRQTAEHVRTLETTAARLERENAELAQNLQALKEENRALKETAAAAKTVSVAWQPGKTYRNPLRWEDGDNPELVSFFAKE